MKRLGPLILLALGSCCGPEPDLKSVAPYERYLGVRELGEAGDAESVRAIVKSLDDPHYLVVTGALEALGDLGSREFLQHVAPRAKHRHPLVRAYACLTIGRLGNPEGIPVLVEGLRDPDPGVGRAAIRALASFGNRPEVTRPLVEAVGEKEPSVALLAHETLRDLTGRQDVERSKDAWTRALP